MPTQLLWTGLRLCGFFLGLEKLEEGQSVAFNVVSGADHGRILLGRGCLGIAVVLNARDAKQ